MYCEDPAVQLWDRLSRWWLDASGRLPPPLSSSSPTASVAAINLDRVIINVMTTNTNLNYQIEGAP